MRSIVPAIFLLMVLSGCASNRITGIVYGEAKGPIPLEKTFVVVLGDIAASNQTDLIFEKSKEYLTNVMVRNGFKIPINGEEPALVIHFSSSSSSRVQKERSSMPIYAPTGGLTGTMTNGMTTYSPTYQFSYATNTVDTTYYMVSIEVDAKSGKSEFNKTSSSLWKTTVLYLGTVGDLRILLPYLIEASGPSLGKESQPINVHTNKDDPYVTAFHLNFD